MRFSHLVHGFSPTGPLLLATLLAFIPSSSCARSSWYPWHAQNSAHSELVFPRVSLYQVNHQAEPQIQNVGFRTSLEAFHQAFEFDAQNFRRGPGEQTDHDPLLDPAERRRDRNLNCSFWAGDVVALRLPNCHSLGHVFSLGKVDILYCFNTDAWNTGRNKRRAKVALLVVSDFDKHSCSIVKPEPRLKQVVYFDFVINGYQLRVESDKTQPIYWQHTAQNAWKVFSEYRAGTYRVTSPLTYSQQKSGKELCNLLLSQRERGILRNRRDLKHIKELDFEPVSELDEEETTKRTSTERSPKTYPSLDDCGMEPCVAHDESKEHQIELLIVATERMKTKYGNRLEPYLISTINSVSNIFRKPSFGSRLRISISAIITMDKDYSKKNNLYDWSNSNQDTILRKFCNWVNSLRSPKLQWDTAMFVNTGSFNSSALGVAHRSSICGRLSCLLSLDRGFGTGHVIAHELGHQLGANHDYEAGTNMCIKEKNDKMIDAMYASKKEGGRNGSPNLPRVEYRNCIDYVMSGAVFFDLYPPEWSERSRLSVQDYIKFVFLLSNPHSFTLDRTESASCLLSQAMANPQFSADKLEDLERSSLSGNDFSISEQCHFTTNGENQIPCFTRANECKQLHCSSSRDDCHSKSPVGIWAEGTPCTSVPKGVCFAGECFAYGVIPSPVHGAWSEWTPWSECSRPCDGGIRVSHRECNNPEPAYGGHFCLGYRTRISSCNLKGCTRSLPDVRQELCDEAGRQINTKLEAYKPKFQEGTACQLICMASDQTFPHNHSPSKLDGLRCYDNEDAICINGECVSKYPGLGRRRAETCDFSTPLSLDQDTWTVTSLVECKGEGLQRVGCDGILGSKLRYDNCNICGGDNSTCVEISGAFDGHLAQKEDWKSSNMVRAVEIPHGSMNIRISKVSPRNDAFSNVSYGDYNLLTFDDSKIYVRRGETRESFLGAQMHYSGSAERIEFIHIDGTINHKLTVFVKQENSQTQFPVPKVTYRYFLKKEDQINLPEKHSIQRAIRGTTQRPYYKWEPTLLSGCFGCEGTEAYRLRCVLVDESRPDYMAQPIQDRTVSNSNCRDSPRPDYRKRKCSELCNLRWSNQTINPDQPNFQSKCSAHCGEGIQTVWTVCERLNVRSNSWEASQRGRQECIEAGLGTPNQQSIQTCQGSCNPIMFVSSPWSQCDGICGRGLSYRHISCLGIDKFEWPLAICKRYAGPASHQLASDGLLPLKNSDIHRILSDSRFRTDNDEKRFEDRALCTDLTRCNGTFKWLPEPWTECKLSGELMDDHCELNSSTLAKSATSTAAALEGFRQRTVSCLLDNFADKSFNKMVNLEFCHLATELELLEPLPISLEACTNPICYRWSSIQWEACSASCGKGTQLGKLHCQRVTWPHFITTVERTEEDNCAFMLKPVEERELQRECDAGSCWNRSFEWRTSPWSECSKQCGSGVQHRTVTCYVIHKHHGDSMGYQTESQVEDYDCESNLTDQPKPHEESACDMGLCARWIADKWSSCQGYCEYGIQTRSVKCAMPEKMDELAAMSTSQYSANEEFNRKKTVADSDCRKEIKPSSFRACVMGKQCSSWVSSDWDKCSAHNCGFGERSRSTTCSNNRLDWELDQNLDSELRPYMQYFHELALTRALETTWVADHQLVYNLVMNGAIRISAPCDDLEAPINNVECFTHHDCRSSNVVWWPVPTTECERMSGSSNFGVLTRRVICLMGLQRASNAECYGYPKPKQKIHCIDREYRTYSWNSGSWSNCPEKCGRFYKTRKVTCVDDLGDEQPMEMCNPQMKPPSDSLCQNKCEASNCQELKQKGLGDTDGVYKLRIQGKTVEIFCAEMGSERPREYLVLSQENTAHFSGASVDPMDREQRVERCCEANNGSTCAWIHANPQMESTSMFRKIGIDLNKLQLDRETLIVRVNVICSPVYDVQFVDTYGEVPVPYGAARDCLGIKECLKGHFTIDLRGTGFRVATYTSWKRDHATDFMRIDRAEVSPILNYYVLLRPLTGTLNL
ncbi:A disintegrin and metalloproteinase with thrombospondin motifs 9, partial [Cichlidogyrus casuarinus]